ncbi:hypothetical protein ACET3Z_012240 [Daucus carota]
MEKGCDTVPVFNFGQTEVNRWWKPHGNLFLQIGGSRVAPIFRGICGFEEATGLVIKFIIGRIGDKAKVSELVKEVAKFDDFMLLVIKDEYRTELEDIAEVEQLEEDNELGDEDDLGDFIAEEDLDGAWCSYEPSFRRGVNKQKPRQAQGVSSSALQEAHDIFGNVDDLLKRRAYHDDSGRRKERRLCGGFDPNILAEKYMTEKGDLIRNTGFPERWQVSQLRTKKGLTKVFYNVGSWPASEAES